VWFACSVKNKMSHDVSIGIWEYSSASWGIDTLKPQQTKWVSDTGPLYMTILGDMIIQKNPRFDLTQTYEGQEAYELEAKSFDHKPNDDEVRSLSPNTIVAILGGQSPKTLNFVDGTSVTFDVFGPTE